MTRPERDLSRLPKWAQDEIDNLKRDVHQRQLRIDELLKTLESAAGADTDTFLVDYMNNPHYRPLPPGSSARFKTGEHTSDFVEARIKDGIVEIYGGDALQIELHSSNTFKIHGRDRGPRR